MSPDSVAVVGAGISGLATAYFLKQQHPEVPVTVFEKEAEAGGKVRSSTPEGYVFDWGPNGFVTSAPETLELALALGLGERLRPAAEAARHRFIYQDGGLRPLPMSPPAFLRSELLRPHQKLRALGDLLVRPGTSEETVHAFAMRHFGRRVAEVLAGPMVLGVSGGDAKDTSLDALFPGVRRLEGQRGSLIRAMVGMQRATKAKGSPRGRLTGLAGGMQDLIDALRAALAENLQSGCGVQSLEPVSDGFVLTLESGATRHAGAVVLAVPAFAAAQLLGPFLPEASELAAIPYAGMRVFGLGYDRIDVPNALDGFGFLVPRNEGLRVLGVLYSSSIFPDRAPASKVLLRVICGGAVDPEFMSLADDEALEAVRHDLELALGIVAEPEMVAQATWPTGIPQYRLGHRARVERVMRVLPPGLGLTGNAYHGVGLNDCVRDAGRVAASLFGNSRPV